MSKGIYITTKGLNRILRKFENLPGNVMTEAKKVFREARDEVHREAVIKAPADEGGLRLAINKGEEGGNFTVSVQKMYGAYVESGTKRNFRPTPGFEGYFRQFKGPSGMKGNPIDNLQGWVRRKGLAGTYSVKTRKRTGGNRSAKDTQDRRLAFLIWRKIRVEGIKAQPYLFPAYVRVRRAITPKLIQAIDRALNKK